MVYAQSCKEENGARTELSVNTGKTNYSSNVWFMIKKIVFVITTLIVIFAVLRNSLTFQLQRFLGASGNFWQYQWNVVLEFFKNDYNLFVYGSVLWGYIIYWSVGLLYAFVDLTGFPQCIRKYKTQPGTNEPVDIKKLAKAVAVVHVNQLLSIPVAMLFHYLFLLRGYNDSQQLPTLYRVLTDMVVFILIEEICFYYSHRMLHHKLIYKWIHKKHHEWQAPVAITALYCHPVEQLFANLLPIFAGPLIMGSHFATFWLWLAVAVLNILNDHSGYHLPFLPSPEFHDYHHLKFNQCYGVLGILDLMHGTDDRFRNSKSFIRHIVILSFVSAREAFPDQKDAKTMAMKAKDL